MLPNPTPPRLNRTFTTSTRTKAPASSLWGSGSMESPYYTVQERVGASRRFNHLERPGPTPSVSRVDSLQDLKGPLTRRESIQHVTNEVFLVARMAVRLWSYLGLGWRWMWNCWLLIAYAVLLFPGFFQMVLYYFFSKQITRSVVYGRKPRNRLDLYTPKAPARDDQGWPVVVFITGGAWTIGYKAWGSLLGRRLSEHDILVACLDYRNFPQGSAVDMLEDVNTGISWVLRHIAEYGGNPGRVYLCGQSAGAHLSTVAMLSQVERICMSPSELNVGKEWDPLDVCGCIGVSGAYCLTTLAEHLHSRGLYKSLFRQIMMVDGKPALGKLSPTHMAHDLQSVLRLQLPEILLLHGEVDKSVPCSVSVDLCNILKAAGVRCRCIIYDGKSHTAPLVDDPLMGGRNLVLEDILEMVLKQEIETNLPAMVPKCLARIAGRVCPF